MQTAPRPPEIAPTPANQSKSAGSIQSIQTAGEFTAQAEQLPDRVFEELESYVWAGRNEEMLAAHGKDIASTGLAGAEFERI